MEARKIILEQPDTISFFRSLSLESILAKPNNSAMKNLLSYGNLANDYLQIICSEIESNRKLSATDWVMLEFIWGLREYRYRVESVLTAYAKDFTSLVFLLKSLKFNPQLQALLIEELSQRITLFIKSKWQFNDLYSIVAEENQGLIISFFIDQIPLYFSNSAELLRFITPLTTKWCEAILHTTYEIGRHNPAIAAVIFSLYAIAPNNVKLAMLSAINFTDEELARLEKHSNGLVLIRLRECMMAKDLYQLIDKLKQGNAEKVLQLNKEHLVTLIPSLEAMLMLLKALAHVPVLDAYLYAVTPLIANQVQTITQARDLLSAHAGYQGVIFHELKPKLATLTRTPDDLFTLLSTMNQKTKRKYLAHLMMNYALPFMQMTAQDYLKLLHFVQGDIQLLHLVTRYCDKRSAHMKAIVLSHSILMEIVQTGYATREGTFFAVLGQDLGKFFPSRAEQNAYAETLSKKQATVFWRALGAEPSMINSPMAMFGPRPTMNSSLKPPAYSHAHPRHFGH